MNSRSDDFIKLLTEMYGKNIVGRILDADISLKSGGISTSAQKDIKEQVGKLEDKFGKKILNLYEEWVFDFPGWFGKLNLNDDDLPAKPIMVVGQDPHLPEKKKYGEYELYAAYSACDPCEIENENIWSVVPLVTGFTNNESDVSGKSLIYATDWCYITPKHVPNDVKSKNKIWRNISIDIGKYFVKKQIDILLPRLIVSNGSWAYNLLTEDGMFVKEDQHELFSIGNKKRYIKIAKNKDNGNILVSVPHLGGRHTSFWGKQANRKKAKDIIKKMLTRYWKEKWLGQGP